MSTKNFINEKYKYMYKIKDLFKCYIKNSVKPQLLSQKISSEISLIPELITFIGGNNLTETKTVLSQLGSLMQIKECDKCHFFHRILSDNTNNNFLMIIKGSIMELGIKYIKKNLSFKEYILFLTKIYLLKEKNLYWDCIRKNNYSFPLKSFKNYIDNFDNYYKDNKIVNIEEEKNENNIYNIKYLKDIDIIKIGKEINMKDFDYFEELNQLKKKIDNSSWRLYKKDVKIDSENNYDKIIDSFFELYNYNNNVNIINDIKPSLSKEEKFKVYLPYFFKKRIINPISFIGDLNYPFQTKNYTTFISLEKCFITYIDKSKLNSNILLFKFSHEERLNYIHEKLFTKHYIFKHININFLKNFGKYFQILHLDKDEIIFNQGELNNGIYIITKGNIRLISKQSYLNLIDLNYSLLHSTDYCTQYISDIKKKELNTNRCHLNGYYEYNSELNNLMKNPIFAKNSKIYDNINFGLYKIRDILGLGETFNYQNNINFFTAKVDSNNTEVVFIPREIFQALLSNDIINKKCGIITEEKTKILRDCINKYKNFFENKINIIIHKKINISNINISKSSRSQSIKLKNINQIIKNFDNNLDEIKKNKYDFIINKDNKNKINNEKSKIISAERNTISYNEINSNKIKKNNDLFSLKKKLISKKLFKFKKLPINKKHFNKTIIELSSKIPNLSQRSNYSDMNFNSESVNNFLTLLKKEKNENIKLRCESAKRYDNKIISKNRDIFCKIPILNKSSNDINRKNTHNKRFVIQKFDKYTPISFLGSSNKKLDKEKK